MSADIKDDKEMQIEVIEGKLKDQNIANCSMLDPETEKLSPLSIWIFILTHFRTSKNPFAKHQ